MQRTKRAARRRRIAAGARRASSLDARLTGVVLAIATGFRFLAQRHFAEPGAATPGDLLIAAEVVLIPLALAAMVVAGWGERWPTPWRKPWRERGPMATIGGARGAAATLAAAALLLAVLPATPPPPSPAGMGLAAPLLAAPLLAVAEELLRRGFLLNEISALLGGDTAARAAAVGLLAGAEALAHAPAGLAAAAAAGAADVVLGLGYLAAGRSLWSPIAARAIAGAGLLALGG